MISDNLCLLIMGFLLTVPDVESQEKYTKKVVCEINWGDDADEVGYLESLEGWGAHLGPTAFDVDTSGNIYVLDNVNNRVLIFGNDSAHIATFDIRSSGREFGCIRTINDKIWVHDPFEAVFYEYSVTGNLERCVLYDRPQGIGFQFDLAEDTIYTEILYMVYIGSRIDSLSNDSVAWYSSRLEKQNANNIHTKRLNRSGRLADRKSLPILYQRTELDTFDRVGFLGEDAAGNVYFIITRPHDNWTRMVYVLDFRDELLSKFDMTSQNDGFLIVRNTLVDEHGSEYTMDLTEGKVIINKWSPEIPENR